MKPIPVLIADDEPLARELVRNLLVQDEEVEVVGECGDGATALSLIRERRPEIVLLDIEMPARDGVDLLGDLAPDERPVVVYLTAYDEHAVRAFGLEALDYVLKPFSDDRFFEALGRAKRRVRESTLATVAASLVRGTETATASSLQQGRYVDRFAVKRGDRQLLIPVEKIRWIESEDYYVRLHLETDSYLLRASLTSLESELDPARFQRVHRKAIVRRELVREVRTLPGGVRTLVLDDGTELRVSRARAHEVERWLVPRSG